jgi:hypothetical protein
MDVYCSTCAEPWDVDHLRHESIFDIGLSAEEAEAWRSLPGDQKLADRYRNAFRSGGWEFGQTLVNVLFCPCCPRDSKPDQERIGTKAALETLFGDDEDGLAATFEDYKL